MQWLKGCSTTDWNSTLKLNEPLTLRNLNIWSRHLASIFTDTFVYFLCLFRTNNPSCIHKIQFKKKYNLQWNSIFGVTVLMSLRYIFMCINNENNYNFSLCNRLLCINNNVLLLFI